jgi:hypothetical protein
MQHLDEGTIHSWLDGALSADEAARVEAHVKECAQCQAAVAEARGFIAASSRILTALDNAPRGVIPAAAPKRRMNTFAWRVAATVLVVAAGTLVVVRTGSYRARSSETEPVLTSVPSGNDTSTPNNAMADAAGRAAVAPTLEKSAATNKDAATSGPATKQTVQRAPAATILSAPAQRESRADAAADNKPELLSRKSSVREGNVGAAAPTPSAAPPVAAMAPQQFGAVSGGRVADVAPIETARENWRIREIGPRRAIGEKQTLYEVAAGDTVVFAEESSLQLQSVVATGAGATQTPAPRGRAAAKVSAAAADTPRTAAAATPAAAPPAERSFPSFTEAANGVNTLTWKDFTTGTMVRLSGRHTRAELEEIRRRIERMRAAAAADSVKKTP